MNDFSELENQLRKLRPVQPSADLVNRVERALAEETSSATAGVLPRERKFHFNWLSLGLGVAAAAALLMFALLRFQLPMKKTQTIASTSPAPAISTNDQLVASGLTQVVYHTRDEGLQFPGNSSQPMRRGRSHTRATFQGRKPKTAPTSRMCSPREECAPVTRT